MGLTQGMCDSTFFTEIFTEAVLKGRVSIGERSLCGPPQMIAYELPLGLGLLGVVLSTGSLRLDEII